MKKLITGIVLGTISGMISVLAVTPLIAEQSSTSPQVINLPGRSVAAPFSDAVLAGNTLYLAGRLGLDPETQRPPATAEQEARNVLDGIHLRTLGGKMTTDRCIHTTVAVYHKNQT